MNEGNEKRGPICPYCNIVQTNLVPLDDKDHSKPHKGKVACVKCKRLIRAGRENEIKKFKRMED